jgi:hypothetical protein
MWKALLLPLCLLAASAKADELSVQVRVEPPLIPWHRSVSVELSAEIPASLELTFPEVTEKEGRARIRKAEGHRSPVEGGKSLQSQRYVIDPLSATDWLFPALSIPWEDGENTGVLKTAPIAWTSRELTEEEKEFAAHFEGLTSPALFIKKGKSPSRTYGALLAATILASALFLLWLRQGREKTPPPSPPLPAWTVAFKRLQELKNRDLPGQGRIDLYYVDLSAILRYYFEDRFRIPAPEQTSPELLEAVEEGKRLDEEQYGFLRAFLRQCDRVKFALYQADADEMKEHFSGVKKLVQQTIPADPGENEEGGRP